MIARSLSFFIFVALFCISCGSAESPPDIDSPPTDDESPTPTSDEGLGTTPDSGSPPPATLTIDGQSQTSAVGTFCWTMSDGVAMCADMIGHPTPIQPLSVPSPFSAELSTVIPEPPDSLSMTVFPVQLGQEIMVSEEEQWFWWNPDDGQRRTLPIGSPGRATSEFELTLEPGLYALSMFVAWPERGDVNYGFLIEVQE